MAKELMGLKEYETKQHETIQLVTKGGQERTASKYIKYLAVIKGEPTEAIKFIQSNIRIFRKDPVILGQWYNIYRCHSNTKSFKEAGIIKIILAVVSNIKSNNFGKYVINGTFLKRTDWFSHHFIKKLKEELNGIDEDPETIMDLIGELNVIKEDLKDINSDTSILPKKLEALEKIMYIHLKRSKAQNGSLGNNSNTSNAGHDCRGE